MKPNYMTCDVMKWDTEQLFDIKWEQLNTPNSMTYNVMQRHKAMKWSSNNLNKPIHRHLKRHEIGYTMPIQTKTLSVSHS